MTRVGMVHTVAALADRFDREARAQLPGLEVIHVVNPALLQASIDGAEPARIRAELRDDIAHLRRTAEQVLVTCSSLGDHAEAIADAEGWPVHRIDTAMAREAARRAGSRGAVAVLATLPSTLEPTSQLLRRHLADDVTLRSELVDGAFGAEPQVARSLIRDAILRVREDSDVVVLAQASMAPAVADLDADDILTSPVTGLAAFLEAVEDA